MDVLEQPTGAIGRPDALDDFLGAIYALILAKSEGFLDRPKGTPTEHDKVQIRAEQVAKGEVRLDGKWMAGFHFNSGILRLSAVYHRILRIMTNDHSRDVGVGELRAKLLPLYKGWTGHEWVFDSIKKTHKEVTSLKHDAAGVGQGREAEFTHALDAVDELVTLLEAWPTIR